MEFSILNLKILWDFIGPIVQDLLKDGGTKWINRSKSKSTRDDFFHLYNALGDFKKSLESFVDMLAYFLKITEETADKNIVVPELLSGRGGLGLCGAELATSLAKVEVALRKIDPTLDIYAHETHGLLHITIEVETLTLTEIQQELLQLRSNQSPVKYGRAITAGTLETYIKEQLPSSSTLVRFVIPKDISSLSWPMVEQINLSKLSNLLSIAQNNLELCKRSIDELRQFIKGNVPLGVE